MFIKTSALPLSSAADEACLCRVALGHCATFLSFPAHVQISVNSLELSALAVWQEGVVQLEI